VFARDTRSRTGTKPESAKNTLTRGVVWTAPGVPAQPARSAATKASRTPSDTSPTPSPRSPIHQLNRAKAQVNTYTQLSARPFAASQPAYSSTKPANGPTARLGVNLEDISVSSQ
jgi:hypothetical protein